MLAPHSSPLGQLSAQNVSPWNCAHTAPPVQSESVVHSVHAPLDDEEPDEEGAPDPPPSDEIVGGACGVPSSTLPEVAHPADPVVANPRAAARSGSPREKAREIRIARMSARKSASAFFTTVIRASHPAGMKFSKKTGDSGVIVAPWRLRSLIE